MCPSSAPSGSPYNMAAPLPCTTSTQPKYMCTKCQQWFATGISQTLFDVDSTTGEPALHPPVLRESPQNAKIAQLYTRKSIQDIFNRRHSCWVCAHIWFDLSRLNSGLYRKLRHGHANGTDLDDENGYLDVAIHSPEPEILGRGVKSYEEFERILIKSNLGTHLKLEVYRNDRSYDLAQFKISPSERSYKHPITYRLITTNKLNLSNDGAAFGFEKESVHSNLDQAAIAAAIDHDAKADEDDLGQFRLSSITKWLLDCDGEHEQCKPSQLITNSGSFFPTRLLEIEDSSNRVRIRQVTQLTPSEQRSTRYMTLSYCWGSQLRKDRLLVHNYNEMVAGFNTDQLGKTSRQAIKICSAIGIKYLWIDSLCIVQDDQQDWLYEAPRMHEIYGNSYLNLAALSSKGSEDGICREALPLAVYGVGIEVVGHCYISFDTLKATRHLANSSHIQSPLFARGWVQQEMLLAPRSLKISDGQMYWSCRQSTRGTEFGTQISDTYQPIPIGLDHSRGSFEQTWQSLIHRYSATSVTFPEDRYNALSGIAAFGRDKYRDFGVETRLVAGCWEHNLARWLLWTSLAIRSRLKSDSLGTYIPSWSWLICESTVRFFCWSMSPEETNNNLHTGHEEFFAQVQHVETCLARSDQPYGPVHIATVTLRAPILRATIRLPTFHRHDNTDNYDMTAQGLLLHHDQLGILKCSLLEPLETSHHEICAFDHQVEPSGSERDFKCAILAKTMFTAFFLLILEETPIGVVGERVYKRCGHLTLNSRLPGKHGLHSWENGVQSSFFLPEYYIWEDIRLV